MRKACASDEDCLNNGKTICDTDPNCYGIAWYTNQLAQPLKICRSTRMVAKTDGWRTMMKQGSYILCFLCLYILVIFSIVILLEKILVKINFFNL